MASLKKSEVERLAKLADLKLSETEIEKIAPELSEIISFFDQLKEVNTDNIEPTSQTTGLTDIMRGDEINSNRILSVKEATSGSENINNNYFEVNALLDKNKNKS